MMKPVSAVDGARKIIARICSRLPEDARWSLEGRDGADEMYYLTVYAHIEDSWTIREEARELMAHLLDKGVTLVLVFEQPSVLDGASQGIETFPVRDSAPGALAH